MQIRRGKLSDLDELARLEALGFPKEEAASKERIAARLAVFPELYFILENDGEIISYINGLMTDEKDLQDEMYENPTMHNPSGKNLMIFSVVTNPKFQHKGNASFLMEYVIAECRKTKTSLVLTCKEHLVSFYGKFGYQDEGISASEHGGAVWHQMRYTI